MPAPGPQYLEEVERLLLARPCGDEDALLQAAGGGAVCPGGFAQSLQPDRVSSNRAGGYHGIGPFGVGAMPSSIRFVQQSRFNGCDSNIVCDTPLNQLPAGALGLGSFGYDASQ